MANEHRHFSDETVVPSGFFDQLLDDLDEDLEVVPNLAKAAEPRSADETRMTVNPRVRWPGRETRRVAYQRK